MKHTKTLVIIILVVALIAIAWHRIARAQTPVTNQQTVQYVYCPAISQIQKNPVKQNWFAHTRAGFWKSYHLSFATNLTQFTGAEWVGENVGQIFCVYQAEQKLRVQGQMVTQPVIAVVLVFDTLAPVPKIGDGKWEHKRRGIRTCETTHRESCPFQVNVKPKIENIYQEAEALKYEKSDTLDDLNN